MNDLNVLMPMVLVAVPIEPIRVDDPVEPWEGMIPAQQGALLRAANYPDGFADPYKSLSLMSQSHVRLYWLSCVARAALIAADELNAFEWMDRWDDNAVAGAYTNNEPEHHKARELFWKSQDLFINKMRVEANSRMDYQQSFAHLHCSIPEGGLSGFDVNTMLHRSAASRATRIDTRGWYHIRHNLYFDHEVYEMSDDDTEPGSPIEIGSGRCDFLEHIGKLNRVSADKERTTEELLRRRVTADRMITSSKAAMLNWEILEVTPPKWPVPQDAAALTEEQCRTLRSNERETFMFDNGGYDREDFTLERALSERRALSEIVDPEGDLNGIQHALKAEFTRAYRETKPEHRKALDRMEPVLYRLMCHYGCTGLWDPSQAILRALESVDCSELATVLDIRTGEGTSMYHEIKSNLEFCQNEIKSISQNRTDIGGPDYIETRCPICHASPTSKDPANINELLQEAKTTDWRETIAPVGWFMVEASLNPMMAFTYCMMMEQRRGKTYQLMKANIRIVDLSPAKTALAICRASSSYREWRTNLANLLEVRRQRLLTDQESTPPWQVALLLGVRNTTVEPVPRLTPDKGGDKVSKDEEWFIDLLRRYGSGELPVLHTDVKVNKQTLSASESRVLDRLIDRHSLNRKDRNQDWQRIFDDERVDQDSGRKQVLQGEIIHSRFERWFHELGQISASLPSYLIDVGSLKIKLPCHTGCDDLQDPRPAWIHTLKAMSLMPSGLLNPIQKAWDEEDKDRLTDILKETQRNFDEWTESIVKKGYVCPICLQGMAGDVTGVTTLFNEALPLAGLPRVYFFMATVHVDLRFLTALERLTSNVHQCHISYEHVMAGSNAAAIVRPLTGIEQHRGPHHRCQIAGDGQGQRWIALDLESEQIELVKTEILAGSVTIQFTTTGSDPQEIFVVPATEPFIVVVNGSPLVALGRLCSECGTLSLGDVSHSRAEEFYCVCNHHNVSADRVQILNERHPLISAAVLELDRRAKELIPTIESLPFTAMTPSKDLIKMSEHRNTLSVYRVAKCDKCSHVMAAVNGGQCTNCTADWSGDSGSVIQATPTVRGNLNERLIKTLEKAKVIQSAAWCLQQELFTSEAQMKEIQQNEVSRHFTSYPFAMKDEVVESVKKGLPVVSAVPTNQKDTVATIRSTLELVEKSASTPSSGTVKPPYTPLTYLTMRSGSEPWVQRIQHQQHLVKAVTAAGMRTVLLSSMIGRLVVTDSNQDCTTGYVGASEMMSYIAKALVLLKSVFATMPHTALHEAAEELIEATTRQQIVYIEASMLVATNALMLKLVQALIPRQAQERLALRYKDVKTEMVFWVQYIAYVFEQDHSNAAALRDRDLAGLKLKMLTPMQPGTSVPNFRTEYAIHVRNHDRCSKTKWWSGLDTDEYEMGNVGTLFSAMPWYSDFITKFHRKRVSDPSNIGIEYLWTKADHMNEAYERSLTENLAKKFKTAASINTISSRHPRLPPRKVTGLAEVPGKMKYVIEIGAGTATWSCDHLDSANGTRALCIDIIPPSEFWTNIPMNLRGRIRYVQSNISDPLDEVTAIRLLQREWRGAQPEQVTHIHFSPECQTLSEAGVTGSRDRKSPKWRHPHRIWDGSNFIPREESQKAKEDDRFRSNVLIDLLLPWSRRYPEVHISVENPRRSIFLEMPDVKMLVSEGWRVNFADHCVLADPTLDTIVTQKPTVYLTVGYGTFNVECKKERRCRFMIPRTELHRYVIRNSKNAVYGQLRVDNQSLRSRIPRGVCAFLRHQAAVSKESEGTENSNDSMQVSLQRQMAATPTGRHIVQVLEHSTPEDGKKMRRTESEPHELDNTETVRPKLRPTGAGNLHARKLVFQDTASNSELAAPSEPDAAIVESLTSMATTPLSKDAHVSTFFSYRYERQDDESDDDLQTNGHSINTMSVRERGACLADTGSTTCVVSISPESDGARDLFSRIDTSARNTKFSGYGGTDCESINCLGSAWVQYMFECEATGEVSIMLRRAYIVFDPNNRFRSIYSPGAMSPYGWNYIQRVNGDITLRFADTTVTLKGDMNTSRIISPTGLVIKLMPSGSSGTLRVLPKIDPDKHDEQSLDRVRAANRSTLKDIYVREMSQKGSATDSLMFDQEKIQSELHSICTVHSIAATPQKSIKWAMSSATAIAPVVQFIPTAEELGVPASSYAVSLANLMAKLERLHIEIANSFVGVSAVAQQDVADNIATCISCLQAVGNKHEESIQHESPIVNQLEQRFIDAGLAPPPTDGNTESDRVASLTLAGRSMVGLPVHHQLADRVLELPFLQMSTDELSKQLRPSMFIADKEEWIQSINEESNLAVLENSTFEILSPHGLQHLWIGQPTIQLLYLLFRDRRAQVHLFSNQSIAELYALLHPSTWHQLNWQCLDPKILNADMIKTCLRRDRVDTKHLASVHHERTADCPSLDLEILSIPLDANCIGTERYRDTIKVIFGPTSLQPHQCKHSQGEECDHQGMINFLDELWVVKDSLAIEAALNNPKRLSDKTVLQLIHETLTGSTEHCIADQFTRALDTPTFTRLRESILDPTIAEVNDLSAHSGATTGNGRKRSSSTSAMAPPSKAQKPNGEKDPQHKNKPRMSMELARLLHARFGHAGRGRLQRALRLYGWLGKWELPSTIPCAACNVTKARRLAHTGKLRTEKEPGATWHLDIFTSDQLSIDNCKYAAVFRDEASALKIAIPIARKSDLETVMPDFLSRLHTLPRTFVMDSGGENVSKEFLKFCYKYAIKPRYTTKDQHEQNLTERTNQSLRDTAMTMLASAGMSPIYWSYALVYAAFIDQFVPDINGVPPYLYWHERLPERVSLPLFGADLVVRQMEDAAQQQFSPPGTHCKFLGFDPKSNAAFVVHMDSDGMPVRRTTEILQRSYQESEVAFNIDPGNMVTLADYECLTENKPESENDSPVPIEQFDFSTIDVDPSDLAMWQDAQRFMAGRRKFLHRRGDLSSMEIENLISREWRRRAGRQLQKSYIPVDKVAYQEALLRGYNSDEDIPEPVDKPEASALGDTQMGGLQSTDKEPRTRAAAKKAIEEGQFFDTACVVCKSKHFDRATKVMLICDVCQKGYHKTCIGQTWTSPAEHGWCCSACLVPGTRIDLFVKFGRTRHGKRSRSAIVRSINQKSHLRKVELEVEGLPGTDSYDLTQVAWKLPAHDEHHVFSVDVSGKTIISSLSEPKSYKAVLKIKDDFIRERWLKAMADEWNGLKEAGVYKLVERPSGIKCIPIVWVLKIKAPKLGEQLGRFKARAVLLGNLMEASPHGNSSPTPRLSTFRYLLSYAAKHNLFAFSADITQAFLSAAPATPVYASMPPGFEDPNGRVAFLLKNLYGANTGPYSFNCFLHNHLVSQGFEPNPYDGCVYTKMVGGSILIIMIYVDDSLAIHAKEEVLEEFYRYSATPAGGNFVFGQLERSPTRFLGFDICRVSDGFILSQVPLISKVYAAATPFMAFGTKDLKATTPIARDNKLGAATADDSASLTAPESAWLKKFPYRELLGAVGYIVLGTRPDATYSYKEHGRWASNYIRAHCESLLALVRYLYQTRDDPLVISSAPGHIHAKCDADWGGSSGQLSTAGWIVFDGDAPISWAARTNKASTRSTAEAEFMSINSVAVELIYIKRMLESIHQVDLGPLVLSPRLRNDGDRHPIEMIPGTETASEILRSQEGIGEGIPPPTIISTDSLAAKAIAEKPWISDKMRHVKTSLYFVRSYIASGDMKLYFLEGKYNCADIMTKAFGNKSDAKKEQIEEFIRHKQEALGCKRLKAISAAKGSFVLKHTTAVNCQVSVSLSENNVHGDRY